MLPNPKLRVLCALLLALPGALPAQRTVTMASDSGHAAGGLHRTLFGAGYRDEWTVPITVPVLDLDRFAGGLTAFQEGGNQSRTLRLRGADGKVYMFRSTRKFLPRSLPEDVKDTPAGDLIHDQSSAMHPTGHLLVSGLQVAAGVLHPPPDLYVLPDHPRLGEFRSTFAGLMGQLEERPQDYDDNPALNFGGAEKLVSASTLLRNLEESMDDYLDQRDYLRARLIDFLVGDTDRGADQWEFARYDAGDRDRYRSIPRDRDYAFMHSDGWIIRLASMAYPKLALYNEKFANLRAYMFMTREFDRSHLSELTWADWQRVIGNLQSTLNDRAIDRAILRMPAQHRQLSGPHFAASLKARRDDLMRFARRYYDVINEEAVVFGSDEAERAEIDRHADGSVTVRLFRQAQSASDIAVTNGSDTKGYQAPAWERRFLPAETFEIRVHLERGNDYAIVRGQAAGTIDVRIMGGEGDDVLVDSTGGPGRRTVTTFYDAYGNNNFVTGPHTRVSRKPYVTRQPIEDEDDDDEQRPKRVAQEERRGRYQDLMNADAGFVESKTSSEWTRDWGEKKGLIPDVELHEGSGLVLGIGYDKTDFGFRRMPYETRYALIGMISPTTGRLGAELVWDRHPENSKWSFGVRARGTQFEANRFFGWGNDSPHDIANGTLVHRNEVFVHPALRYRVNDASFVSVGPIARWSEPDIAASTVADSLLSDAHTSDYGARADFVLNTTDGSSMPRTGFRIHSGALVFDGHSVARATVATYLPLGAPTLALRVGGSKVFGDDFPLQDAAFIGGSSSLRGYRWNRFAGDAALFGGAELRIKLIRAELFTRGDLGVLALADAGRVWFDGDSEGDWHAGFGGGLWFHTLGQTLSVSYAKGEDEGRVYFTLGAPF